MLRHRLRGRHGRAATPVSASVMCLLLLGALATSSAQGDPGPAVEGEEAASSGPESAARAVLLWPEEGRTYLNGIGLIAALVTTNFDPPREGSIKLLVNGNVAATFMPAPQDGEGNRRLHVVLPDLGDGSYSVEVQCVSVEGRVLARHGATFDVNSKAEVRPTSARSLDEPALCHPVGFCDSDAECSGHGTCTQGACLCEGDFTGERCEHDILNNLSFLPGGHCRKFASCETFHMS